MSEKKCIETLDNFKNLSLSSNETLESERIKEKLQKMSAELFSSLGKTPDESGSTESSSEKSIPSLVKCETTELDSTKSEYGDETGSIHKDPLFSVLLNKEDIHSAIANIRKAMKENETLLEKSLKFSADFLKNFPKKSEPSTTSLKRIREYSSSDTLSSMSDGDSEMSFEVRKLLENRFSMSSGYCSPCTSTSVTPQSTAESCDSATQSSTSDLATGKRPGRSDSLETLVTDRSSSTQPWTNNSFFYSSTTRKVRNYYNILFDFEEFKNACSLPSNAYRKYLNIKYISLPLSRFLMEDLLDFVDFLNGTEIDLRESGSNIKPFNFRSVELAFVRENFETGVQQADCPAICNLLEELQDYNIEHFKTPEVPTNSEVSSSQSHPDSTESQQGKTTPYLEVVFKSTNSSKDPSQSYHFFSLETYRLMSIEPEIESLEDSLVTERLETLNEEIRRLMIRCISDTKMVLEICIKTKYNELEKHLRQYYPGIEVLLHRLLLLREDGCTLLGNLNQQNYCAIISHTLKVKIQIASALKNILLKFSEINSEFLENSPFKI